MTRAIPIVLLLLVLALPVLGWWLAQRSLPPMSGIVTVAQLSNPATIKFDGRSIPYIEADSEADAYTAQGYAMARDRMFQMDMLRRLACGELSEVFGTNTLSSDKLMRTIGFKRLAEVETAQLSPSVRDGVESFARGVNAYLWERHNDLPGEFILLGYKPRPWEAADSLAILEYMSYTQDESWKLDDLRQRIADKIGKDAGANLFQEDWSDTPVVPSAQSSAASSFLQQLRDMRNSAAFLGPFQPSRGSNAWAVGSKLSENGNALLACDYHGALASPDTWYLCSLTAPGFHCAGATICGVPGILAGRNESVSWGCASLRADVQDIFLEEFSPQFPTQYRTESGWQNAGELTEEIPVRFGKNFLQKVLVTRHGPVLLRNGNTAVSLAWSANKVHQSALESVWKINRAASVGDITSALQQFSGPTETFVYADKSGSIALHAAGDIPVRSNNGQGTGLVPGAGNDGQWGAYIGFADLPNTVDPAQGFVVAANQKLLPANYTHVIGHQWCDPYRAFRISSILQTFKDKRKAALPDMEELQSDQYAQLSSLIKRELRQAITSTDVIDRGELLALDQLEHWNGQLDTDSQAATIYEAFLQALVRRVVEPKLGPQMTQEYLENWAMWPLFVEYFMRTRPSYWMPPEERNYPSLLITSFSQALKEIKVAYGEHDQSRWSYRSAHQAFFPNIITRGLPWLSPLLNIGPIAVGGDQDTVNANSVAPSEGKLQFECQSGPIMRMLVDMGDHDKFYQATSLGESGHRFSPFHKDQLAAWIGSDPLPIAFSANQVERQMQSKLILSNR